MKEYYVDGLSASGTADKTAANIIGSSAIRPLVNFVHWGFETNPNATDQQVKVQIGRTTAAGTAGSAATPSPRDPQDVAAVCTAGITHSAEPTYTAASLMSLPLNQRASKEWGCADGKEICGAATASNGVATKVKAVTAALVMGAVVGWRE